MSLAFAAPVKLNLFLEVRERQSSGYHEIVTVMECVDFGDTVKVATASELSVRSDRADVPGGADNIVWKAVRAAEAELGVALPAAITLRKVLPPGTGLGAGSSDAVTALRGVLQLHGVECPRERLQKIVSKVGSDTAFFVHGGVCLCTGRGEVVQPVAARGERHYVILVSKASTSTAAVYGALQVPTHNEGPGRLLSALRDGLPLEAALLFNRLDEAAFGVSPELGGLRAEARMLGGRTPHLSGSGGALFFLAKDRADAEIVATRLNTRKDWMAYAVKSRPPESA